MDKASEHRPSIQALYEIASTGSFVHSTARLASTYLGSTFTISHIYVQSRSSRVQTLNAYKASRLVHGSPHDRLIDVRSIDRCERVDDRILWFQMERRYFYIYDGLKYGFQVEQLKIRFSQWGGEARSSAPLNPWLMSKDISGIQSLDISGKISGCEGLRMQAWK